MKTILQACAVVCLFATLGLSQGVPIPQIRPQYLRNTGAMNSSGFLCTYLAGTTTSVTTYSDVTLSTALPNPIRLNSAGRPQTGSSGSGTETQVYVQPGTLLKYVLHQAGTGSTCNGTAVGSVIWTQDNITAAGSSLIRDCRNFSGATVGAKITACMADLPATGGTADARGIEGAQSITSMVTLDKPIRLLLGATSITSSSGTAIFYVTSPGVSIECLSPGASTITATVNTDAILLSSAATGFVTDGCKWIGRDVHVGGYSAIDADGPTDILVKNSWFSKWGGHCINTGGAGTAQRWTITNNTFEECNEDGVLLTGTTDPGAVDSIVMGNQFTDIGANSIDVNGHQNLVTGNRIQRSGQIVPTDNSGILVAGIGASGSDANDNVITNNVITDSDGPGILVVANHASRSALRNLVMNNVVRGNSYGINVGGNNPGTMSQNTVAYNLVYSNTHGITIDGASGTVADNQVFGNTVMSNSMDQITDTATRTTNCWNKTTTSHGFAACESTVAVASSLVLGNTGVSGKISMPNNTGITIADSGGTARNAITLNGSNVWTIGVASQGVNLPGGVWLGGATGGNLGNGTINASGFGADGTAGATGTVSVRKGDDSGACDLVFKYGLITSTTC